MSIMNFIKAYIEVKKAETLEHQQIRDLQLTRFRHLLKHVLRNSRFYRQYYFEHGISESDINNLIPQDLPVIDKQTVMENYDDIVCDPALKKEALEQFIIESPDPASTTTLQKLK
jgi:phenylacetate-CoA ligase